MKIRQLISCVRILNPIWLSENMNSLIFIQWSRSTDCSICVDYSAAENLKYHITMYFLYMLV